MERPPPDVTDEMSQSSAANVRPAHRAPRRQRLSGGARFTMDDAEDTPPPSPMQSPPSSPMPSPRSTPTRYALEDSFHTAVGEPLELQSDSGDDASRSASELPPVTAGQATRRTGPQAVIDLLNESDKDVFVDRAPTPPPSPLMTAEELELFANSSHSEAHPHLGRCTENQHNRVLAAFQSTRAETCLFSRPYRSMVAKRKFRCLRRRQQLVDVVLNAHLELLVDQDDADAAIAQRPQCHHFSTHFMTTLLQLEDPDPRKRGHYNFSQVHAWGDNCPGGDLFNL